MEKGMSDHINGHAKEHLRSFVERLERLHEDRAAIGADISELLKEAKSNGFCTKTIRKVVSLRKKEEHTRLEEEAMLLTYMGALGMLGDTPLGQAAIGRAMPAAQITASPAVTADAGIAAAKQKGANAAHAGEALTSNPYLSDDPRYTVWDRAYAEANVHAVAA